MCAVLVQNTRRPDGSLGPELTPCGQTQGDQKTHLQRLIGRAKEDWGALDHPNWSIRDVDSSDFLDSNLQPGQVGFFPPPLPPPSTTLRLVPWVPTVWQACDVARLFCCGGRACCCALRCVLLLNPACCPCCSRYS